MTKSKFILPAVTLAVIAVGAITAPKAMAQDAALQRADVVAALQTARNSGENDMLHGEDSGSFRLSQQPLPVPASRAQVSDDVRVARSHGEIDALHGEDSGSFRLSQQALPMPASRAEVSDAVRVARSHGELDALYGEDSGSFRLSATAARRSAAPDLFAGPVAD